MRISGKLGFGAFEVIVTVVGSVAVKVSPVRNGAIWPPAFCTYAKWSTTFCASILPPSENVTPGRNFSTNFVLSLPWYDQELASPGTSVPSDLRTMSGS